MKAEPFYVDGSTKMFGGFNRDFSGSEFVLIGVPFDGTSSYRPGSRFAPNAIREASSNIETWSWRTGIDLEEVKIHDLGDLAVVHGDASETIRRVGETVEDIVSAKKLPIVVGGEHLISLGVSKAIKDATIISFDAHFDLREEYLSNKLSHACVMRRISEQGGQGKIIFCGVRATYRDEVNFVKEKKIPYLSALDVLRNDVHQTSSWLRKNLEGARRVYISIDADVLDPAYAPGIGNPEPEGISPTHLLDLLNNVIDDRVVGFDLVEVSPPYDNGNTAALASKIIFEVSSMIKRARG
uniref:Agmatinase n=1 Tax=Candidatus Methanomethylicus mesodigestus TaxID=1867258 RepID=A0A7C3ISJ4_9CREN